MKRTEHAHSRGEITQSPGLAGCRHDWLIVSNPDHRSARSGFNRHTVVGILGDVGQFRPTQWNQFSQRGIGQYVSENYWVRTLRTKENSSAIRDTAVRVAPLGETKKGTLPDSG